MVCFFNFFSALPFLLVNLKATLQKLIFQRQGKLTPGQEVSPKIRKSVAERNTTQRHQPNHPHFNNVHLLFLVVHEILLYIQLQDKSAGSPPTTHWPPVYVEFLQAPGRVRKILNLRQREQREAQEGKAATSRFCFNSGSEKQTHTAIITDKRSRDRVWK